jgi:hypothetical protein
MILAGAGIVFKAQRFLRLFLCFICDRLWQNRLPGISGLVWIEPRICGGWSAQIGRQKNILLFRWRARFLHEFTLYIPLVAGGAAVRLEHFHDVRVVRPSEV